MSLYKSAIEEKQDVIKNTKQEKIWKKAIVTSLFENGCPKLTFDGEEQESNKKYSYIYTYMPQVGDKVLLMKTGSTYVIIGDLAYDVTPATEEEGYTEEEIKQLAEDQILTHDFLVVSSDGTVFLAGTKYNTINYITNKRINTNYVSTTSLYADRVGFFGKTPTTQGSVSYLPTGTTDISKIVARINSLINAVKQSGLIDDSGTN